MAKNRAHAFINITGLAFGISGLIFILLWVQNERSFDRFHEKSPRTYRVLTNYTPDGAGVETSERTPGIVGENIRDKIAGVESVTRVLTVDRWPGTLCFKATQKSDDDCDYRDGVFADDNFFSTFSYPVVAGTREPFSQKGTIAISKSMAQALFGSDQAIGATLLIDARFEMKVTAVFEDVPHNSSHQFDFVLPFQTFRMLRGITDETYWHEHPFETFVVTQDEIDTAAFNSLINERDIRPADFAEAGLSFFVQPAADKRLHDHFSNGRVADGGRVDYVRIVLLVGIVVVIIACVNYVNLATSRAIARAREIGVRKVNGANRASLMVQFFGESLTSVAIAMVVAVGIVQALLPAFNQLVGSPLEFTLTSGQMPVFLLFMLVAVAALAGIYPAMVMAGFNPVRALKNKITAGGTINKMRQGLTVVQMVASCVLVIFTMVLFLQLSMIKSKNLGYDRENIIRIEPTYRLLLKWEEFRSELLGHANIANASIAMGDLLNIPLTTDKISWPGKDETQLVPFKVLACHFDFFETFQIDVVEGRAFSRDQRDGLMDVVLTREAVARMGLNDPIGARIKVYNSDAEVVGVTDDIHGQSLHHAIEPTMFVLTEAPERLTAIYVKYNGTTDEAFATIETTYDKFEPDFSMVYWFFDQSFDKQYKTEATMSRLAIIFTGLAIAISLLGVIGLSTYNIGRRMREIGVRKVFGATVAQVFGILSVGFLRLIAISSLIAWPLGAWLSKRWLEEFAFRVSVPWYTYVVATALILLLTLVAIGIQNIRAAMVNPSSILKDE